MLTSNSEGGTQHTSYSCVHVQRSGMLRGWVGGMDEMSGKDVDCKRSFIGNCKCWASTDLTLASYAYSDVGRLSVSVQMVA